MRLHTRFTRTSFALLVPVILAGCGGNSPTTPGTTTVSVASVAVAPASSILLAGQTVQLVATVKDSAGATLSGRAVAWSSTAPGVATVGTGGMVTAVAVGTTSITATSEGRTGIATISVGQATSVTTAGGTVTAAGGNVVLSFPAGAVGATTNVIVGAATLPAAATLAVPGTAFEFGPSGTTFGTPVTATIKYNPSQLPAGQNPQELRIYYFGSDGAVTRMLSTRVDTAAHTVTAALPHFSLYGVCGVACIPHQPVQYSGIDVSAAMTPIGPPSNIPGIGANDGVILQGGSAGGGGGLLSNGELSGVSYRWTQVCASVGCSLLPNGSITATFTDLGQPGPCVVAAPDCGRKYSFVVRVSATTPPGVYSFVIDVSATRNGSTDGGESGLVNIAVPAPGYTPAPASLALSAPQGGSTTDAFTITRVGGFAGAVTLSAEGLPSGITASFNPASTTGNGSTMTLNVAASVTPRDYNFVVRSTAAGFADQTMVVGITVTGSGFTIAGTPGFISTTAGNTGKTGIKASRTGGFSGTIAYSVTGVPAGLTAAVTTTGIADSVVLTVTAGIALATGDYPITVNATATGAAAQQVTITVAIAPPGVVAVHIDFSGCDPSSQPLWLAYQDGSGSFVHLTGNGGVYDFNITSARGAIATVTSAPGGGHTTSVQYATQAELIVASSQPACGGTASGQGKVVTASVVNIPSISVYVSLGASLANPTNAGPGIPTTLSGVASGPLTAIAFNTTTPRLAIVRRDQNIPNGGALAPFDFSSSEAFTQASATASIPGAASVSMAYITDPSCAGGTLLPPQALTNNTIWGIPPAQQRAGDLHLLVASSADGQSVGLLFHTMADLSLSFGGPIGSAQVGNANGVAYKQLNASASLPGGYSSLSFFYGDASQNGMALAASTAYMGGQSFSFVTPNLASVAGYQASWAPAPSASVSWNLFASSSPAACTDGAIQRRASLSGAM